MSEMELKAAKFEIIERFEQESKALGVIESKLRLFGLPLKVLGEELERTGRPESSLRRMPDLAGLIELLAAHAEAMRTTAAARAAYDGLGLKLP